MSAIVVEGGQVSNRASTGDVTTADCIMLGFYVNSTGGTGTVVFRRGGAGGTALCGTITPAIGFHRFPASCPGGLHVTIANTINVSIFYVEGTA